MIEHPNVVPIAVVTAVIIFLARELLEGFRRSRSNGRKKEAIRRFLAAECERNNFAIARLLDQLGDIRDALKAKWLIEIKNRQADTPRLVIHTTDGESSSPVPRIHMDALNKYLFETAALDAGLFELMEAALDALIDAAHARNGVVEYVADDPAHLDGFSDWAAGELNPALDAVRALYFRCTTEPLERTRVR